LRFRAQLTESGAKVFFRREVFDRLDEALA
jgi:hypothetical protein